MIGYVLLMETYPQVPPWQDPPLTQVTCGSCTPRWAKAEAAGGITGHPFLTVTLLLAAVSKNAWLAPWWGQQAPRSHPQIKQDKKRVKGLGGGLTLTLLAELAVEASGAEALAADRVAGGSLLTLTDSLATRSVEARGAG